MAYTNKERISIALSSDTCKRIDNLCAKIGTSRSKLCATIVEQHLESMEEFWNLFNSPNQMDKLISMMKDTAATTEGLRDALKEANKKEK